MTGLTLIVVGLLALFAGVVLLFSSNKNNENADNGHSLEKIIEMAVADGVLTNNERNIIQQIASEKNLNYDEINSDIEGKISASDTDSETELIDFNKKNGYDFEKFIVRKFDKNYFTIKEWAGDKYVEGIYAETTPQPDILFEFQLKQKSALFSVECKWRKNIYDDGILFAKTEQLERYKNYQETKKIPVFVAIGIGGKGMSPEQLFIVPLKEINQNFIHINMLKKYAKDLNSNFFYNLRTHELR